MKPVQSSTPEIQGDLLPAFAKGEASPGASFQAALALALQGIRPISAASPTVPPQVPAQVPPETMAPTAPTFPTAPAAPTLAQPEQVLAAQPVSPPPYFESRPRENSKTGLKAAPMVSLTDTAASEVEKKDKHVEDVPTTAVAAQLLAQVPRISVPENSKPGPTVLSRETDRSRSEPGTQASPSQTSSVAQPQPLPDRPLSAAAASARQAAPYERPRTRNEPPAEEPMVESHAVAAAEPVVDVRVTVEETSREVKPAVTAPPVKDQKLRRDVEAVEHLGDSSAAAPRGEGLPRQLPQDGHAGGTAASDAPAQLSRPQEPPKNAGTMDRVTLHLPDDAGGGRIQIAVRGDVVHARIVTEGDGSAHDMEAGLDELRSALSRQGFQETHVRVENRPAADALSMPASAARESAGAGDSRPRDSQTQDRREREPHHPDDPRPDPRRQQDGKPHQRSRRERER